MKYPTATLIAAQMFFDRNMYVAGSGHSEFHLPEILESEKIKSGGVKIRKHATKRRINKHHNKKMKNRLEAKKMSVLKRKGGD